MYLETGSAQQHGAFSPKVKVERGKGVLKASCLDRLCCILFSCRVLHPSA